MSAASVGALLGGLGLFLLGMWMLTEGLRLAAGAALRDLLARTTGTRLKALATGIAVTALIHSSGVVTVMAIGFVNAGLLSLAPVLWLLFGSNVGTTVTGWLVALLGFKFSIDAIALPMIGVGMLLRIARVDTRVGSAGMALAGFGVVFLGIDGLQTAFADVANGIPFPHVEGFAGVALHVFIGCVLTVLMQSSSATTALTLTAAQGGMLGLESAAAVVIGANIGSTTTAVIAASNATATARRAAAAHVIFNVLSAAVALAILPWLLSLTGGVAAFFAGNVDDPSGSRGDEQPPVAIVLALFHTGFNLLGLLLMWPLAGRMADMLSRRFRTREEDEAKPRWLDASTGAVPALAVEALSREVARFGSLSLRAIRDLGLGESEAVGGRLSPGGRRRAIADAQQSLAALESAIDAFVVQLNRASMSAITAHRLALILRRLAYYVDVVERLPRIAEGARHLQARSDAQGASGKATGHLRAAAAVLLADLDPTDYSPIQLNESPPIAGWEAQYHEWEAQYQRVKAELLEAGALGILAPDRMESLIRANSALRRVVQQAWKALRSAAAKGEPEAVVESAAREAAIRS